MLPVLVTKALQLQLLLFSSKKSSNAQDKRKVAGFCSALFYWTIIPTEEINLWAESGNKSVMPNNLSLTGTSNRCFKSSRTVTQ